MPAWKVHFGMRVDVDDQALVRLVQQAHALGAVIRDVPIPPYLSKRAGQRRAAVVG